MAQTYGLFSLIDLGRIDPNAQANLTRSDLLIGGILYDQAQHNADIAAMLGTFCETVTVPQLEFRGAPINGRNQPLDEFGRSIPVQPGAPYTVGFPIIGSGAARGANFLTNRRMTNAQLAETLGQMYRGDYNWVADQVLAALFNNASYTHTDRITGAGAVTVYGPANGDAQVYARNNTVGASTDTHFYAQANPISDADNPFPTIYSELTEHPDNAGEVVTFVPNGLVSTITALTNFYEIVDPAIQLGQGTARLATAGPVVNLPEGVTLKGKMLDGPWVYEWNKVPATYMISMTTGGRKPLARRVLPEADLQGFQPAETRRDFPYFEDQWMRWEGYGALSRTAVVITRIGNASYAVPSGFGVPLH